MQCGTAAIAGLQVHSSPTAVSMSEIMTPSGARSAATCRVAVAGRQAGRQAGRPASLPVAADYGRAQGITSCHTM